MKTIGIQDNLPSNEKSVVTVGNFDGVHKGHAVLLNEVVEKAKEKNLSSVAVTFHPHTRSVVYPELSQMILTTLEEKSVLINSFGIDYLLVVPFDAAFRELSSLQFLEQILLGKLNAALWVMGEGHSVGKNLTGGKNFLREVVSKYHIDIFAVSLYAQDETTISSTHIRKLIGEGAISEAVELLGHPYLICAPRIEGTKTGSRLGYPTLNFKKPSPQKVIPPAGVYAAELTYRGARIQGALYFGNCPTFSNRDTHFEFHALDLGVEEPQLGESCTLWLHSFVRRDSLFSDELGLVNQIKMDIDKIREFFSQETHSWS